MNIKCFNEYEATIYEHHECFRTENIMLPQLFWYNEYSQNYNEHSGITTLEHSNSTNILLQQTFSCATLNILLAWIFNSCFKDVTLLMLQRTFCFCVHTATWKTVCHSSVFLCQSFILVLYSHNFQWVPTVWLYILLWWMCKFVHELSLIVDINHLHNCTKYAYLQTCRSQMWTRSISHSRQRIGFRNITHCNWNDHRLQLVARAFGFGLLNEICET